jgi:tetratricopeptide (TPR) repeat protein
MKLNIYFIHNPNFEKRGKNIQDIFKIISNIYGLQNTFMHIISTTYDIHEFNKICQPNTQSKIPSLSNYILKGTNYELSPHASCAQKHYDAIKKISNDNNDDIISIILEDDCMINQENMFLLLQLIQDIHTNKYDFVYLSLNKNNDNPSLISQTSIIPETSCAYFISKNAASKIIDSFLPVSHSMNVHLAQCIIISQFNLYSINRKLFIDGSKDGHFASTILMNNHHTFDSQYIEYFNNPSEYLHLMSSDKFQNNPDYLYLKGKGYIKSGNYTSAKEVLEQAFELYKKEKSANIEIPLLNPGDIFLTDFYNDYVHVCQQLGE